MFCRLAHMAQNVKSFLIPLFPYPGTRSSSPPLQGIVAKLPPPSSSSPRKRGSTHRIRRPSRCWVEWSLDPRFRGDDDSEFRNDPFQGRGSRGGEVRPGASQRAWSLARPPHPNPILTLSRRRPQANRRGLPPSPAPCIPPRAGLTAALALRGSRPRQWVGALRSLNLPPRRGYEFAGSLMQGVVRIATVRSVPLWTFAAVRPARARAALCIGLSLTGAARA